MSIDKRRRIPLRPTNKPEIAAPVDPFQREAMSGEEPAGVEGERVPVEEATVAAGPPERPVEDGLED